MKTASALQSELELANEAYQAALCRVYQITKELHRAQNLEPVRPARCQCGGYYGVSLDRRTCDACRTEP